MKERHASTNHRSCSDFVSDRCPGLGRRCSSELGANVLAQSAVLPAGLAALLTAYPQDFLYGCIAADITVGKKFTHYLQHCHRWGIGLKILKKAGTDRQRACAYGYLCHLAADTVAHNYYVPYKIIRSFATVTMKHAYWEMRFETFVDKDIWSLAREVCSADQQDNDKLLRSVVTTTIFSFGTNKRIFNSIMLMSRLEKWQQVMQTLSDKSRYQLAEGDRDEYLQLAQGSRLLVFCSIRRIPGCSGQIRQERRRWQRPMPCVKT